MPPILSLRPSTAVPTDKPGTASTWTRSFRRPTNRPCGACQADARSGGRSCPLDRPADVSPGRVRPVRALCVEPMASTAAAVQRMLGGLGWAAAITLVHAAVSSAPGSALFPVGPAGFEASGLGSASPGGYRPVEVVTLDDLARRYELGGVDVLTVDTEGNDVRVLLGGLRTLPAVRYLEFEHHVINRWARSDLQDTVRDNTLSIIASLYLPLIH
jgi:FkbM family methyltransferase